MKLLMYETKKKKYEKRIFLHISCFLYTYIISFIKLKYLLN